MPVLMAEGVPVLNTGQKHPNKVFMKENVVYGACI